MDWILIFKLGLLGSASLLLLAISVFVYQLIRIAMDIRRVAHRVEMMTDVSHWLSWFKNMGAFRRVYEKFRD